MIPVHEGMWILYKNKMPVTNVKVATSIPHMNPLGIKYKRWWKKEKRRSIEGFWTSFEGDWKFVPGPLYFFVNYWKILLTPKNSKSSVKRLGLPFLRDLDWIKGFVYDEARGFSGFTDDQEYTSHVVLEHIDPVANPEELEAELMLYGNPDIIRASLINSRGKFKKYISAREYLRMYFKKALGKPMYYNMKSNVVDMESRGGGKSYFGAATVGHNFLFDGATDYDDYIEYKMDNEPMSSESLVGAIDAKYSGDVLTKVRLGLESLPGKIKLGEHTYPSPFYKQYHGDWGSAGTVIAEYDKKIGGVWEKVGSKSKLQHRSFATTHTAANGTRPNFSIIEETGFMSNLVAVLGQMKEAAADGTVKQGIIWMFGTGGDMIGGATEEVKQVFYSPEAFDCLAFEDEYEGYQTKIGFFVPAWMTLNQFKDELGNTNWRAALHYLEVYREKLKKNTKTKQRYDDEVTQRPIVHSEVFLLTNSNILPVSDLKEHMDVMLSMGDDPNIKGRAGWMHLTPEGNAVFKLDNSKFPTAYPVKATDDNTGAVVIWENPEDDAEYGWYVGGVDPYDFDEAPNSVSLGSIFIVRRGTPLNGGFDRIVAEYTGRPGLASDFYEQCRRLSMWYGQASLLYENEKQMIKDHFKRYFSIGLLAYTPGVLKANETSKTAAVRVYGQHMSTPVKKEAEIYLRDWLLKPIGDGKLQLHTIKSIPLLLELISYNENGNFDRVISLMLSVIQLAQMRNIIIEEEQKKQEEESQGTDFFDRKLFTQTMGQYQR